MKNFLILRLLPIILVMSTFTFSCEEGAFGLYHEPDPNFQVSDQILLEIVEEATVFNSIGLLFDFKNMVPVFSDKLLSTNPYDSCGLDHRIQFKNNLAADSSLLNYSGYWDYILECDTNDLPKVMIIKSGVNPNHFYGSRFSTGRNTGDWKIIKNYSEELLMNVVGTFKRTGRYIYKFADEYAFSDGYGFELEFSMVGLVINMEGYPIPDSTIPFTCTIYNPHYFGPPDTYFKRGTLKFKEEGTTIEVLIGNRSLVIYTD